MKTLFTALPVAALLGLGVMAQNADAAPEVYAFDKTHTEIRASWMHLGFSRQAVSFTRYDGELLLDFDTPSASTIDITFDLIDGLYVGPNQERFIDHLNAADLFDTGRFPAARFVATGFETEDGVSGVMTGDLTLLDQTHPIRLDVILNRRATHPFSGKPTAGFTATGTITRSQWGLDYAVPAVSDEIWIEINAELNRAITE